MILLHLQTIANGSARLELGSKQLLTVVISTSDVDETNFALDQIKL